MQLYAGSSQQFIDDTVQHRIAEKLRVAFYDHFRFNPSDGEVRSWQNSLQAMCNFLLYASLRDHGIILEYQLPLSSKRLDLMITGRNDLAAPNAVIIELKQWDVVEPSNIDGCVATFVGQRVRDMLHPSVQVGQYAQYLDDCQTVFSSGAVAPAACSFAHNVQFEPTSELFSAKHTAALDRYPLFTGDQTPELAAFLGERIGQGDGQEVLAQVLQSSYRASKKLLEHTSAMIAGQQEYVLLDEQLVVFNAVLAQAKAGFREKQKAVILVQGGPGTGKSVIALNLVGELSRAGFNAQHATGSRAFTGNVRRVVGSRAGVQFKYWNIYGNAESNEIDVLVLDEAHRLRDIGDNRFTPGAQRSGLPQVDEIIRAAKVCVFFIDDLQVVRPKEVGSSELIRQAAKRNGATLREFELETQFRCNGSNEFIDWVDNTLDIRRTPNILWDKTDSFAFEIMDSVYDLEAAIRSRAAEGFTARLSAGFCWRWSDPLPDGTLVHDVQVGEWSMPWNAKAGSGRLAAGIPKSDFWASDPMGVNQVGCIYTAQGFEYDYAGVIFGRDLRYDPATGSWIGDPSNSQDGQVKRSGDRFLGLVKSVYRVLLTRGMKGCYVHFQDKATRDFVRSRME